MREVERDVHYELVIVEGILCLGLRLAQRRAERLVGETYVVWYVLLREERTNVQHRLFQLWDVQARARAGVKHPRK